MVAHGIKLNGRMTESADAVLSPNSTVWCRLGVIVGCNANRFVTVAAWIRPIKLAQTVMHP